jgi:hypothetical protein
MSGMGSQIWGVSMLAGMETQGQGFEDKKEEGI